MMPSGGGGGIKGHSPADKTREAVALDASVSLFICLIFKETASRERGHITCPSVFY